MTIYIYGGGRLGRQLASWLNEDPRYDRQALVFVDDTLSPDSELDTICHQATLPVIGGLDQLIQRSDASSLEKCVLFAIGYSDMEKRLAALERVQSAGISLMNYYHPSAVIPKSAVLGEGNVIGAQTALDVGVTLGDANFIDLGCTLCELVALGRANYISAGSVIGGRSRLGSANFLGLQSVIRDEISIGDNNTIPMQGFVHQSLGSGIRVLEQRTVRHIG